MIVHDWQDKGVGRARSKGGKILLVGLLAISALAAGDQPGLSWSSGSADNKPSDTDRRGVGSVLAGPGEVLSPRAEVFEPSEIRAILKKAADWQLAHPKPKPRNWTNAVFYMGLMAAHRATGEPRYLAELMKMGEENLWEPGHRYRHADDHAVAQIYLDLFQISKENRMIDPFRAVVDRMMTSPPRWPKEHQLIDYWWCDALFMSPPALAKLAAATGDGKYLVFLDRLWKEAHRLLYDQEERLFYRDLRHKGGEEKVFWSRGNAWVLAGIARLLDSMPESYSDRRFYLVVYGEMAERIGDLQPQDGLWRTSLLESPSAGPGESSGTALFCFALAWGIDQGVLDRERFLPVVMAAWSALSGNLDEEGRLGWVQRPGVGPAGVRSGDHEVYGTGALLLAGSEVLELVIDQERELPFDRRLQ